MTHQTQNRPTLSAGNLWCPMTFNCEEGMRCRGRHCAAWVFTEDGVWRTYVHKDPKLASEEEPERPAHIPASWTWSPYSNEDGEEEPACWEQPWEDVQDERFGRCGLVRP